MLFDRCRYRISILAKFHRQRWLEKLALGQREFSSIAVPDANQTVARGINKSGWITGYYVDSDGKTSAFIGKPKE